MKKIAFYLIALTVILSACNRKDFVNKLTGTWKLNKYYQTINGNNVDYTATYDTTHYGYQLVINSNNTYSQSWKTYVFTADTTYLHKDSIYDTLTQVWSFKIDTIPHVDTTITPYAGGGHWYLLNSEEDLQLIDNADTGNAAEYRILELSKSNLNLSYQGQQFNLTK